MKHLDKQQQQQPNQPAPQETSGTNNEAGGSAEAMVEALLMDPVGFVQRIVESSAQNHLANLKDEAELNGAIRSARKAHPEFERFESFILQEVAELIKTDEDGVIEPWHDLLEKGFNQFQSKFQEMVKQRPELLKAGANDSTAGKNAKAFVEGGTTRTSPEPLPSFTREQIANMSINEFLANEQAIEKALKLKRIR